MRRFAALVPVLGLLALSLVAQAATMHQVAVGDDFFDPAQLQLDAGDTVRWTNRGLKTHSVTFSGETREETTLLPGQSRTTTFDKPGTYRYRCGFHPDSMQGTLVVRAASSSTTSTTRAPTTTSTTQDPRGSAITAPPDTSTTTTSSTTTTVVDDTTTTTTSTAAGNGSALGDAGGDDDGNVDGPSAVAALLLLATAGGAFTVARRALP
ncbi:MAG: cupredoxin domain-containing protein [Actinobacteria bacterium]|nr:cupredoxin domain-containing protein [Actinomycetota bacterium]